MATRRLEKVSHVIRSTVSEVIVSGLSDPRVRGLVGVTRVELSPDLRRGKIYLSMMGLDDKGQQLCLAGITHARGYIQSRLAKRLAMKVCPTLSFYLDDSLKEGYKIMQLIDQVAAESAAREEPRAESEVTEVEEPEDEGQQ